LHTILSIQAPIKNILTLVVVIVIKDEIKIGEKIYKNQLAMFPSLSNYSTENSTVEYPQV